jgi:Flp pilus assembly protein TadG
LVLVSIAAVSLLLVAALAIDGGQAYANRRQMQNAADAAAMAGTAAFANQRFTASPSLTAVTDEVRSVAQANGADVSLGRLSCWLVDATGQRVTGDLCTTPGTWTAAASGAAGVEVDTSADKATFFARVAGPDTIGASADAAATMQRVIQSGPGFPFILCGYSESGLNDVLDANLQVRPEAVGQLFALLDPGSANSDTFKRCDTQSNPFKGKGDGTPAIIGEWAGTDTGNSPPDSLSAPANEVLGPEACPVSATVLDGCLMIVPIASYGRGVGSNTEVFIVNFTVMRAWGSDTGGAPAECGPLGPPSPKFCGILVGGQLDTGQTGGGDVAAGQAYAIKLIK